MEGLAVAVAAAPRGGQLLVVATVLGQDGGGAAGLRTSLAITTRDGRQMTAAASACSAGCYQAVFGTAGLPRADLGRVQRPQSRRLHAARARSQRIGAAPRARGCGRIPQDPHARHPRAPGVRPHAGRPTRPTTRSRQTSCTSSCAARTSRSSSGIGAGTRPRAGPGRPRAQTPIKPIAPYWAPLVQDATILGTALSSRPAVLEDRIRGSPDARVLHDLGRQVQRPDARARDDRARSLHAPRLRALQCPTEGSAARRRRAVASQGATPGHALDRINGSARPPARPSRGSR